jgi:hypothetical protein
MWVPTQRLLQLAAAGLINHTASGNYDGPLRGAYLGLCIAPTPAFTELSTISSLTEATYTSYARQAIVWGTTYESAQDLQVIPAGSLVFQPSDAVTPNVITGVFMADAVSAGNLLCGLLFPGGGYPLPNAQSALEIAARFGLDFQGNWGDFAVLN